MSGDRSKGAPRRQGVAGQLAAAGAAVSGAGGAFVATAATACCAGPILAPLIVGALGASGAAWAAGLKPYSAWLLAGSAGALLFGFWSTYRKPADCEASGNGPARRTQKIVRAVLWGAAILWVGATALNLFIPA
ncbi:MAG: hypothetical protein ABI609_01375 [Acidobacteriota bacterium]